MQTTDTPRRELYAHPGLPESWLARVGGSLWIVPARPGGWADRTAYNGHRPESAGWNPVAPDMARPCGIQWGAAA